MFPKYACELLPFGDGNVMSDELVGYAMFIGHVAFMTQVIVVTHSALPANTTHWLFITGTLVTSDVLVSPT